MPNKTPTVDCRIVVQVSLLPDMVANANDMLVNIQDIIGDVMSLTTVGYSVTCSFEPLTGQYTVRLAGIHKNCDNAGKLLYGNGKTIEHAFVSVYLKHFLASKGGIWTPSAPYLSDMS